MIFDLLDATWPAASVQHIGPWLIRQGQGGGSRVSAATAMSPVRAEDRVIAEQAMQDLGQTPLFMIRPGDDALEADLAAAGYVVKDPVLAYAAPVTTLAARDLPTKTAFRSWPPLALQADIWADAGIGPARLAIMDRVVGPKASFLGRVQDHPAGCAFVACHGPQAMLHALEVVPAFRRHGLGRHLMIAAARWARDQGAETLALAVTRANRAAIALYTSLGMEVVGQYHYRIRP
jgi:N-acetylglutamate synthase